MMGFQGIFSIIILGLVIFAAISFVRYLWVAGNSTTHKMRAETAGKGGIAVLERRYAEIEIDRDNCVKYLWNKEDLF